MRKKRLRIRAFAKILPFLSCVIQPLWAEESGFQKFDEVAYFSDDNYDIYDEKFSDFILRSNQGTSAQEIINFLTGDQINIQNILVMNLYRYTNPANERRLLDMPAYDTTYPCGIPPGISIGILPFYNQTRDKYFTSSSPCLGSYLALSDFASLDRLLNSSEINLKSFDLKEVLSLFCPIKLEERRAGAILSATKTHGCCQMRIESPIYYIERNLFINKHDQDAIANHPFFAGLGSGCAPDPSVRAFMKQHVVGDLFGLGDTRLCAYWKTGSPRTFLSGGLELTFPTAAIMADHFIGHHRCRSPMQPEIDVLGLINLVDTADNTAFQDALGSLGICALDRLLRVCSDLQLGTNSFTLAPRVDLYHSFSDRLTLMHMARFTCFMPHDTVRFFRECKTTNNLAKDWGDSTLATQNLNFLTTRLINTIYPQMQDVHVKTRFSFEYTLAMQFSVRRAMVELGYDLWLMSEERLQFACRPMNDLKLDVNRAARPAAMQQKLLGRLMWEHTDRRDHSWHFGVTGDWTANSYGIGHDWSLGLTANLIW